MTAIRWKASAAAAALAALAIGGLAGWVVLIVLLVLVVCGLMVLAAELARPIMTARRQVSVEREP